MYKNAAGSEFFGNLLDLTSGMRIRKKNTAFRKFQNFI